MSGYAFGSTGTGTTGFFNEQEALKRRFGMLGLPTPLPGIPGVGTPTLPMGAAGPPRLGLPTLPAGGGGGGGGGGMSWSTKSGLEGAGYLGSKYGRDGELRKPIDAHIDGDHFAAENHGADINDPLAPSYTGPHGFEGLDAGFYDKNPEAQGEFFQKQTAAEMARAGWNVPARADGGPVRKGLPTLVGERGPELLTGSAGAIKHPLHVNAPLLHGMADFQHLNPAAPTAAQAEDLKLASHPDVPMPIRLPSLMAMNPVGLPVPLPRRANGGPVQKGLPTLVGERGPEVIVPGQDGYVVPNEALAQTPDVYQSPVSGQEDVAVLRPTPFDVPGHPNFAQHAFPSRPQPMMPYTGSYQVDQQGGPMPDTFTFDGTPRVVPFTGRVAKGLPVPLSTGSGTGPVPTDGTEGTGPVPLPVGKSSFETPEAYAARRAEANPENIHVGFTPRTPLARPVKGLPVESDSNGELQLSPRDMRNVTRMLKNDPRQAMQLWLRQQNGKAATDRFNIQQQAQAAARAETNRHNTEHEKMWSDRAQIANDKTTQAAQDKQHALEQHLLGNSMAATNLQMQGQLSPEETRNIMSMTDPAAQDLLLKRAAFNTRQTKKGMPTPLGTMETFQGSGVYVRTNPSTGLPVHDLGQATMTSPEVPDFQTPSVNLPWLGGAGLPSVPIKGQPAQFKTVDTAKTSASAKPADPAKVRSNAYKQALAALDAQLPEHAIGGPEWQAVKNQKLELMKRQYDEALRDLNGDGVPDAPKAGMGDVHLAESSERGLPAATRPAPQPTTTTAQAAIGSLMNRTLKR